MIKMYGGFCDFTIDGIKLNKNNILRYLVFLNLTIL